MSLPNDSVMLLSAVNMMLRDKYDSFEELCAAESADADEIISKLDAIDYHYDEALNQFK